LLERRKAASVDGGEGFVDGKLERLLYLDTVLIVSIMVTT
jgi:hypothetical protein